MEAQSYPQAAALMFYMFYMFLCSQSENLVFGIKNNYLTKTKSEKFRIKSEKFRIKSEKFRIDTLGEGDKFRIKSEKFRTKKREKNSLTVRFISARNSGLKAKTWRDIFSSKKGGLYRMAQNTKTALKKGRGPIEVKMSGDPWETSGSVTATLPIPNDVIITKVTGDYTERDRKLWSFLVAAVWDDLLTTRIHEIRLSKINSVFTSLGGEKTASWIVSVQTPLFC